MLDDLALNQPGIFVSIRVPVSYVRRRVWIYYNMNDFNSGTVYDIALQAYVSSTQVFEMPCRKAYGFNSAVGNGNLMQDASGYLGTNANIARGAENTAPNQIQVQSAAGRIMCLAPIDIATEADTICLAQKQPFNKPSIFVISYFLACYSEN